MAEIRRTEPLVTESRAEQVKQLVLRLKQKLFQREPQSVYLFKVTGNRKKRGNLAIPSALRTAFCTKEDVIEIFFHLTEGKHVDLYSLSQDVGHLVLSAL